MKRKDMPVQVMWAQVTPEEKSLIASKTPLKKLCISLISDPQDPRRSAPEELERPAGDLLPSPVLL